MKSSANKGGPTFVISSSHDTLQRPWEACSNAGKVKLWRPEQEEGRVSGL